MMQRWKSSLEPSRLRRRGYGSRGFTMVEIIVVVIVIAVLAALIAPRFFGQVGKAKSAVAQANLGTIEAAIDNFYYTTGRFPRELRELVEKPADVPEEKWEARLKSKDLQDPWGRPYQYRDPGTKYQLFSLGADGQEGGSGEDADVKNW